MPQFMSSALTFAVFAIISAATHARSLFVTQAFTSLSLISLLTSPLNQVVQAAPQLLACSACFGRIEEFLEQPEKVVCESETERGDINNIQKYPHEPLEKNREGEKDEGTPIGSFISSPVSAVSIRGASFNWSPSADPVPHNITLEIAMHSIEVLLGPIGCGKSTLIQGILGNARRTRGSVQVVSSSSSFCGQASWLMSSTIRDNITAGSAFDAYWYRYTLWTCSLDREVQQLPIGDLTEVGSNGTALSGGQKQRVVCSSSSS
jgi:ATP-binding cassette subfamily C (CFTR/MRP) protein 1